MHASRSLSSPTLALLAASLHAAGAPQQIHAVGTIGMTVASVERSAAFRTDVLGFKKVESGRGLHSRLLFQGPGRPRAGSLSVPAGQGGLKWRRVDALFLGIDHTVIVVADTARSLACYRDPLGLVVAAASENWGPEQERLNNVASPRLRITTLRAPAGPGIELLEYLTPRDGRPAPADARANDLTHSQTSLYTGDALALSRAYAGRAA